MTPTTGTPPAGAELGVDFVPPAFAVSDVVRDVRREEAESAALRRDQGYREGYAQGTADARREVEAAIADHRANAERLALLAHALSSAADDLARRDAVSLDQVDDQIVAIAVDLAERIVGRELEVTPRPVVDAMARALRVSPERGAPVVRVHPDDEATAREAAHADLLRWRGDVSVVADPRVERGGCVVEIGDCVVDAQIAPALERLRAAL